MTNQLDRISRGLLLETHGYIKTQVWLSPPGWQRIYSFSYVGEKGYQELAIRLLQSDRVREQLAEIDVRRV